MNPFYLAVFDALLDSLNDDAECTVARDCGLVVAALQVALCCKLGDGDGGMLKELADAAAGIMMKWHPDVRPVPERVM